MLQWKNFMYAVGMFFKAIGFIRKNRLSWLFIFPLILNVLLWFSGAHLIGEMMDFLMKWIRDFLPDMSSWPHWVAGIMQVLGWIFWLILRVMLFFVLVYLGGYLVMIALSPVFSLAAERTLSIMGHYQTNYGFGHWIRDILRGIMLSFRNLLMELFLSLMYFIGGFVPIIGLLSPLALLITSSYYFGFSFLDYALEQKRYTIVRSVIFVGGHKGLAIGAGIVFTLTMMIPFVGIFLAGFVGIVSVVAATLAVHHVVDESVNVQIF